MNKLLAATVWALAFTFAPLQAAISVIAPGDFGPAAITEDFETFTSVPASSAGATYTASLLGGNASDKNLFIFGSQSMTVTWTSDQEKFGFNIEALVNPTGNDLVFKSGGLSGTTVGSVPINATGLYYFESSLPFDAIQLNAAGSTVVDDVIFEAVPEPSAAAAYLGLAALAAILLRRRLNRA